MKKFLVLVLILFGTFSTYAQESTPVKDTMKCVFMTAKKSAKYNSYTPVIIKGFIVYEVKGVNRELGIELVSYLDENKNKIKENVIIFSFVPLK